MIAKYVVVACRTIASVFPFASRSPRVALRSLRARSSAPKRLPRSRAGRPLRSRESRPSAGMSGHKSFDGNRSRVPHVPLRPREALPGRNVPTAGAASLVPVASAPGTASCTEDTRVLDLVQRTHPSLHLSDARSSRGPLRVAKATLFARPRRRLHSLRK